MMGLLGNDIKKEITHETVTAWDNDPWDTDIHKRHVQSYIKQKICSRLAIILHMNNIDRPTAMICNLK